MEKTRRNYTNTPSSCVCGGTRDVSFLLFSTCQGVNERVTFTAKTRGELNKVAGAVFGNLQFPVPLLHEIPPKPTDDATIAKGHGRNFGGHLVPPQTHGSSFSVPSGFHEAPLSVEAALSPRTLLAAPSPLLMLTWLSGLLSDARCAHLSLQVRTRPGRRAHGGRSRPGRGRDLTPSPAPGVQATPRLPGPRGVRGSRACGVRCWGHLPRHAHPAWPGPPALSGARPKKPPRAARGKRGDPPPPTPPPHFHPSSHSTVGSGGFRRKLPG